MAGVRKEQLVRLGPWPRGINNVADEQRLPRNEFGTRPIALREAANVDLDTSGTPRRRRGFEQVGSRTQAHSLWSNDLLPNGYFVDDGELHAIFPDETVQPLGAFAGHNPVSYALINQHVYWSNEVASGVILPDQSVVAWAPEHPDGQPALRLLEGASLHPGQYQVAVTFTDAHGRESGSTLAAVIDVPEGRAIRLDNIPQPQTAEWVNIYVTDANDQVLRRYQSLPGAAGLTSFDITGPAQGTALDTQFLRPLPPGQIVRLFAGRQLVASGRTLYWSEPLRYGMHDPARRQMRFDAPIDLVAPDRRNGVFVAAGGRTYWLAGADPEEWTLDIAYGYGAVPGSHLELPGDALPGDVTAPAQVWLARSGQIVVGANGRVEPTKKGEAAIDDADHAAPLFRSEGGVQQLVMGLRAPQRHRLAVTDTAVAHVVRRAP